MLIFCFIFFFSHVRILKAVGCFFSNDNEPLFHGTDAGQMANLVCVLLYMCVRCGRTHRMAIIYLRRHYTLSFSP